MQRICTQMRSKWGKNEYTESNQRESREYVREWWTDVRHRRTGRGTGGRGGEAGQGVEQKPRQSRGRGRAEPRHRAQDRPQGARGALGGAETPPPHTLPTESHRRPQESRTASVGAGLGARGHLGTVDAVRPSEGTGGAHTLRRGGRVSDPPHRAHRPRRAATEPRGARQGRRYLLIWKPRPQPTQASQGESRKPLKSQALRGVRKIFSKKLNLGVDMWGLMWYYGDTEMRGHTPQTTETGHRARRT